MLYLKIVVLLVLTGCGFRPMYRDYSAPLPPIAVAPIGERTGQLLRQNLQRQLDVGAASESARYTLSVELEETSGGVAIAKDATETFVRLTFLATYKLEEIGVEKPLLRDRARATAGYTVATSDYANLVAADDARNKAIRQLADSISRSVRLKMESLAPQ
ncbi:MAG: LPS assembly lipoprotein LptE [Holosporales bacterium]|jgi:hypothetical protein